MFSMCSKAFFVTVSIVFADPSKPLEKRSALGLHGDPSAADDQGSHLRHFHGDLAAEKLRRLKVSEE